MSDLLVQVAGLRPGQAVLDVGCGAGACLFAAAREQIPEPGLRAARARAIALLEPLRAADGSLRRRLGFCYTRAATAAAA